MLLKQLCAEPAGQSRYASWQRPVLHPRELASWEYKDQEALEGLLLLVCLELFGGGKHSPNSHVLLVTGGLARSAGDGRSGSR